MSGAEIVTLVLGLTGATGVITAIVTTWLKRGDRKLDEATAIRAELREQNDRLVKRLDTVEADLDAWKEKYAVLRESNTILKAENAAQAQKIIDMQREIDTLRAQVNDLRTGNGKMRNVTAEHARITKLTAEDVETERITAKQADIEKLGGSK
jgi:chromosome segregation ATPase